jgi:hypothetical protein
MASPKSFCKLLNINFGLLRIYDKSLHNACLSLNLGDLALVPKVSNCFTKKPKLGEPGLSFLAVNENKPKLLLPSQSHPSSAGY